jgi:hypothetical protein
MSKSERYAIRAELREIVRAAPQPAHKPVSSPRPARLTQHEKPLPPKSERRALNAELAALFEGGVEF